jgi:hypothetical protein
MVARWGITFMCAVVGVVGMATTAHAAPTGKTAAPRKPPMGFSSWNHFGMSGDEVIMHAHITCVCARACVCVCVRVRVRAVLEICTRSFLASEAK